MQLRSGDAEGRKSVREGGGRKYDIVRNPAKKKGKWEKRLRGRRRKIGNCQESSKRNREMGKVFERETKEDRELLGIQQNIGKWEKRKDGIGK